MPESLLLQLGPFCSDMHQATHAHLILAHSNDSEDADSWAKPLAQTYTGDGAVPCMPSSPYEEVETMSVELGAVTGRSLLDTGESIVT